MFELEKSFLIVSAHFAPDTIEKVYLELRPASLYVQSVDFLAQRLRVLITLLQVVGRQTDQVHLQGHPSPLSRSELVDQLLDIVDDPSRQNV